MPEQNVDTCIRMAAEKRVLPAEVLSHVKGEK